MCWPCVLAGGDTRCTGRRQRQCEVGDSPWWVSDQWSIHTDATSYFGLAKMANQTGSGSGDVKGLDSGGQTVVVAPSVSFDARVIAEFDGTGDVVEWLSRAELLCQHRGVDAAAIIPLRLTGGAFAVWAQLPDDSRGSLAAIRAGLYQAFALDQHAAYEAFTTRRLRSGESADVFLADLQRLAELFGGVPERALTCAFVAGLPESVRQMVRAGSRAEGLDLASVVARARAVLSDERVAAAAAAAARPAPLAPAPSRQQLSAQEGPSRRAGRPRRCWSCGEIGHMSFSCPRRDAGNDRGEDGSAPASSRVQH